MLVHVIDCATLEPGRDPMTDLDVIERELAAVRARTTTLGGRPLAERTRIVVLNKSDVPDALELAEMVKPDLEARGIEVFVVSAVAHTGLRELTFAMARHVAEARAEIEAVAAATPQRIVIRPKAVDDTGFKVIRENTPDGEVFRIDGERPTRWVRQTDFSNDEAVGYLADRLGRAGVEEALFKAGAVAGATVLIGPKDNAVVFDWEPTLVAGAELLGARGTDLRLERGRPPHPRRQAGRLRRAPGRPDRRPRRAGRRAAGRPLGHCEGRGHRGMSAVDRRGDVARARRLVVKVGSSSLTDVGGGALDEQRLIALVDVLAKRRNAGHQVVLVSSGAIAAGIAPLGLTKRPWDLATQQAAASVGQGALVAAYQRAFGAHGLTVGQVLLTADDVTRRSHYTNARRTLDRLLELGIVPIVNENDTVATHEIRFGDNDRLASLVAHLVHADGLVLLTDVDALYDGPPDQGG